jgi:uridine kinase
VGKSLFAQELAEHLQADNLAATILGVDCYLRDRLERAALHPPVSGYDPAAYRLGAASRDTMALLSGDAVQVREYDKVTGARQDAVTLHPTRVLIVEGSMALLPCFDVRSNIALFLSADMAILYKNRCKRELGFGFTQAEIRAKYEKLLPDYHKHVVPQAEYSDLILEMSEDYGVEAIKSPQRSASGHAVGDHQRKVRS